MPHAALLVVQVHRSQPLCLLRPTALLESRRMFELSNGKRENKRSDITSLSGAIPCAVSPCHAHGRIGKSRRCSAALRRIPATFHFVLCTIYIIAEAAPNDKYLRPRKKASARGAADTSYGTNHRTVLKQDFLLRPLYRFLRQEEPSIPGKPIPQMFRLSSQALR